jgi:hypothetical protein
MLIYLCRYQSDGPDEADLSRNVRSRYVLGIFPRPRSHVLREIPPKTSWVSGRGPELQVRHGGLDVGYEFAEEGI